MTAKQPNKGGRPAFKPTDEQRRQVRAMVAYGVPLEDIASVIDIQRKTLAKHFSREIATASAEANAKVAQALYKQAVDKGNVSAQVFWLKTKARWTEANALEITGAIGINIINDESNL